MVLRNNYSRTGVAIYLDRFQRIMPNSRSSFDFSGSGTSGNEQRSQSDMKNVAYNFTLVYGTCYSSGSVYSFFIDVN